VYHCPIGRSHCDVEMPTRDCLVVVELPPHDQIVVCTLNHRIM
jgi:hypothetical protein